MHSMTRQQQRRRRRLYSKSSGPRRLLTHHSFLRSKRSILHTRALTQRQAPTATTLLIHQVALFSRISHPYAPTFSNTTFLGPVFLPTPVLRRRISHQPSHHPISVLTNTLPIQSPIPHFHHTRLLHHHESVSATPSVV